jgi:cytochrome P450
MAMIEIKLFLGEILKRYELIRTDIKFSMYMEALLLNKPQNVNLVKFKLL